MKSIRADQLWEEISDQQMMMMIRSNQMISADHCGKKHGRDADQQIICAADNPITRDPDPLWEKGKRA